jgi:hypothetical protein
MGVKVREWKGAWWLFVDHQGRRKAKRVGSGKAGRKAANNAAEKIAAKLALGDRSVLEPEPIQAAPLRSPPSTRTGSRSTLPCTRSGTAPWSATARSRRSTSSRSLARKR